MRYCNLIFFSPGILAEGTLKRTYAEITTAWIVPSWRIHLNLSTKNKPELKHFNINVKISTILLLFSSSFFFFPWILADGNSRKLILDFQLQDLFGTIYRVKPMLVQCVYTLDLFSEHHVFKVNFNNQQQKNN